MKKRTLFIFAGLVGILVGYFIVMPYAASPRPLSYVDYSTDRRYNLVAPPKVSQCGRPEKPRPDGRSPEEVMSVDLLNSDVYSFFLMLADCTGKVVKVCKEISGTVTYRRNDLSYPQILQEVASQNGWKTEIRDDAVSICSSSEHL